MLEVETRGAELPLASLHVVSLGAAAEEGLNGEWASTAAYGPHLPHPYPLPRSINDDMGMISLS